MGLWDVNDDIEDIFDENFVEEDDNRYLSGPEEAIRLIAKIIPASKGDMQSRTTLKQLDRMMDVDFLPSSKQIQLNNEAQLQMKMTLLSDKLTEQKKYELLKNKSVVGIGGKFSAGKSKFINSLLKAEEELLPEDQNPTTSIPTYIVYGKKEEINAYTSDNEKVALDAEALQALTHKFYEKYSIGFSSFINSLIISEPDMPFQDLVFLDTPGYSKADQVGQGKNQKELSDENKAYVQLRSVDYLIWLVDIENGVLSQPDIDFISKLHLKTPILIVVNKADKKIDEEIERIRTYIENTAKEAGIDVFAVTAYSSVNNEEWNGAGQIQHFLEKAAKTKQNMEDIDKQLHQIKTTISDELENRIKEKEKERKDLNKIIYDSDEIMQIRTLADIYGDTMEDIRDLKEYKKEFLHNTNKLEKKLEQFYGRG